MKALPIIAVCALLGASTAANASSYIVTLQEVGSNVVATGSGTIDTTGLSLVVSSSINARIFPNVALIVTGPDSPAGVDE
jgi:hypothetical protein